MIKNTHNTVRSLRSVLASLLMLVSATVFADEVSINSTIIDKDEKVTVDVNYEMTNHVVGLQMFITLPEGIEFDGGITRNAERIDRDTHDFQYNVVKDEDGTQTLRVVIVPNNGDDAIEGESGKLFSFNITATDNVNSYIKVSRIMESTIDNGKLKSVNLDDFKSAISSKAYIHILNVTESLTMKEGEANKQKVTVNLINGFDVAGMQFKVTLPKGLTPETNSKGRIVFAYGNRLPEDFTIKSNTTADGSVKVVISKMTDEVINNEKSGEEILSFNVIADNTLAESSEIVFSEGVVSDEDAVSLDLNECKVKVTNETAADRRVNAAAYAVLDPQLKAVQEKYDAAVKTIAAYTTSEAKAVATGAESAQIDSLLKAYRTSLDEANTALAIKNTDSIANVYKSVDVRVDALLTVAETAETTALKANTDTYAALDAKLKAVQAKYASAVETLATYKTAEAKAYATGAEVAEIDTLLKGCRTELDAAYAALSLRSADSLSAVYAGLDTRIATLASAAETAEAAAQKTNADSYKILDAQLKGVQTSYNSALAVIATFSTPEGKAYTSNAEATEIDSLLKAYRTSLDEANEALLLRSTDSMIVDYTNLNSKVVALSSAASVAETEALKVNESVCKEVVAKVNDVIQSYAALNAKILSYTTEEARALADGEEADSIEAMIDDLKKGVEDAYAAYTMRDANAYDAQIDSVKEAIAELSSVAETVETATVKINADVYEAVVDKVSEVEGAYVNLISKILSYTTEEAKALADGEEADSIEDMIDDLKKGVEDAYAACTLRDANAYDAQIDAISEAIAALDKLAAETEEENFVKMGDVNGDGEIDVTDATTTIGYILEEDPEDFNEEYADMNGDGEIDITDVTLIIDMVLSLIK